MTYKCIICGEIFEVAEGEEPVCLLCGATGDDLELVGSGDTKAKKKPYEGTQTEKNL